MDYEILYFTELTARRLFLGLQVVTKVWDAIVYTRLYVGP